MELTAAGLSGTFTRFPFHPRLRHPEAQTEQNIANITIFLFLFLFLQQKVSISDHTSHEDNAAESRQEIYAGL